MFNFLVNLVLSLLAKVLGIFSILSVIYSLGVLLPGLAVGVRRLHDIGKSWVWILMGLIPLVGGIILIIFFCKDSDPGTNQFGPNPKGM